MKTRTIIFTLMLLTFIFMGSVCAHENTTTVEEESDSVDVYLTKSDGEIVMEDGKYSDIYVNNSKETNGDGLSFETALNYFNYHAYDNLTNGGTLHLSEGKYSIPTIDYNCTVVGIKDCTIITSGHQMGDDGETNYNKTRIFINLTYDYSNITNKRFNNINLNGDDYIFINCTFCNLTFSTGYQVHFHQSGGKLPDISTITFENCEFLNYSYLPNASIVTAYEYSRYNFNNCFFNNINRESIINSYAGNIDSHGRVGGVYLNNCSFRNCNISGIVKTRLLSYCLISNCSYDFDVSETTDFTSPFYINTTDHPVTETVLTLTVNGNTLTVTLTDINNTPLIDAELEVVTNGRVSYKYTDDNGQFTLTDLEGTYSFEFTYLGDDDYTSAKVVKNLTFTNLIASKISATNVNMVYNTGKYITITLKDDNGNAIKNAKLSVVINGNTYNKTTDSKGIAKLTISLVPNTYTAKITYAGDDTYIESTTNAKVVVKKVTPKLTAAKKTFKVKTKTKKYTITLKDNKGKVLKKAKVTLKVKGKIYKATTNAKGKATFKITKLTKKGTFKAEVKFTGNSKFKAICKQVKLTVKK